MKKNMREKLNKEIENRLQDELWSARIAAGVLQSQRHEISAPLMKKFKFTVYGSTAALLLAVIGLSGVLYYKKPVPTKDNHKTYVQTPRFTVTPRKMPTPSVRIPASFPVHLNDTMFHDNLDNIIEASINMRYR